MHLDELKTLKEQTWDCLSVYKLDPDDSKNVLRYEKLSKLYLTLCKSLMQLEQINPDQPGNELDQFLTNGELT
jgi:hypothetical protein